MQPGRPSVRGGAPPGHAPAPANGSDPVYPLSLWRPCSSFNVVCACLPGCCHCQWPSGWCAPQARILSLRGSSSRRSHGAAATGPQGELSVLCCAVLCREHECCTLHPLAADRRLDSARRLISRLGAARRLGLELSRLAFNLRVAFLITAAGSGSPGRRRAVLRLARRRQPARRSLLARLCWQPSTRSESPAPVASRGEAPLALEHSCPTLCRLLKSNHVHATESNMSRSFTPPTSRQFCESLK